jgi:hypothetical protein
LPGDVERAREIVALFTAFAAEAGLLLRPSHTIVSPRSGGSLPPPQEITSLTRSRRPKAVAQLADRPSATIARIP